MSNDVSDFIDSDFQSSRKSAFATPLPAVEASPATASMSTGAAAARSNRPPSREEIEAQISANQQEMAKLKRAQEEKQRELSALEEMRRRQAEYKNGRQEMLQNLTRGVGLLEEAEMTTRREADSMAKSLAEFKDALSKVQALNDSTWTEENLTVELTRGLTTIENARMEWNSARLKFPVLDGTTKHEPKSGLMSSAPTAAGLASLSWGELIKVGLGLTLPIAVALAIVLLAVLLHR